MDKELIQQLLFAAHDIVKTLPPEVLAREITEASFGETVESNLNDIIEGLTELEQALEEEDEN